MAWKNREGGDKSHSNGVHFKKNASARKAIKAFVKDKLKLDLKLLSLQGQDLLQKDLLEQAAESAHADALAVLEQHAQAMPIHDTRPSVRALYREELLGI